MSTSELYLSVILVLAVIIIAIFARRYWKKRGGAERFSYATPATPRIREAAGDLFVSLGRMVTLGCDFESQAGSGGPQHVGLGERGEASVPPTNLWAGARQGVAQMADVLGRAEKRLGGAPPTYANYLAVYRGLASTDKTLLNAADAYVAAGYGAHQEVAASGSCDGALLGNMLILIGAQLRRIVTDVHRLGVALDVE